jgi:hypothetical protein
MNCAESVSAGRCPDSGLSALATPEIAMRIEYFVLSIANYVIVRLELFATNAIMVTFDEGGGYFDSGYTQIFFWRWNPNSVACDFTLRESGIDYIYSIYVSILKLVEPNWGLRPLSPRSRDNRRIQRKLLPLTNLFINP